ncbi:condensation domain-containing protein [Catenuloplanes atrovinosus]|uniref:Condensation domain-containing protein n=1 Tax=Catenuloplanes atrovinosus TaxID=137266 RepID=A0AAE3YM58_9ACTN|nr:condensation domain-containing protein [Catenuloplanes atrovinosus]MDR7275572.1 hypothetical protein [Catenuloplanes atrovinosus]
MDGELDLARLADAWDLLQRRHPVLGSSFDLANDHWHIEEPVRTALTLSRLPASSRTPQHATDELATVLRAPFDLTRGPLARLHAIPVDDSTTLLGMAADHIACDAWSAHILIVELWSLYRDPHVTLPPIRVTFPDLVEQENAWLETPAGVETVEQRIAMLKPIGPQPPAPIPGQRFSGANYARVHRHRFTVDADTFARLQGTGMLRGLTPSVLAHAALAGALHELTGAEDVGTTLAVANRPSRSLHRTQGWLADNVVVATHADDVRRPAFIAGFGEAFATALDFSQVSLGVLINRMAPEQFGRPSPHPTAAFNPGATLEQRFPAEPVPGLTMTELPMSDGWGYRTVVVHGAESDAGLQVRISVKDRWFEAGAATALGERMRELLETWATAR